jgi:DNA-directed RNA polymerase specialized sigma24 family protein
MEAAGSVSLWLRDLRDGDRKAVEALWRQYFHRLLDIAHKRLAGLPPAVADAEQVALSAFKTFWRRAESGEFPDLADRDGLWELLLTITHRKAQKLRQRETRQKRDVRRTKYGYGGAAQDASDGQPLMLQLISQEPDPLFAAAVSDQCEHLLGRLPDDELRTIALRKLEGYTNQDLAAELDCSLATVERRLKLIRACWEDEIME